MYQIYRYIVHICMYISTQSRCHRSSQGGHGRPSFQPLLTKMAITSSLDMYMCTSDSSILVVSSVLVPTNTVPLHLGTYPQWHTFFLMLWYDHWAWAGAELLTVSMIRAVPWLYITLTTCQGRPYLIHDNVCGHKCLIPRLHSLGRKNEHCVVLFPRC